MEDLKGGLLKLKNTLDDRRAHARAAGDYLCELLRQSFQGLTCNVTKALLVNDKDDCWQVHIVVSVEEVSAVGILIAELIPQSPLESSTFAIDSGFGLSITYTGTLNHEDLFLVKTTVRAKLYECVRSDFSA